MSDQNQNVSSVLFSSDINSLIRYHAHTGYDTTERFSWHNGGNNSAIDTVNTNDTDDVDVDSELVASLKDAISDLREDGGKDSILIAASMLETTTQKIETALNEAAQNLANWVESHLDDGGSEHLEEGHFLRLVKIQTKRELTASLMTAVGSGDDTSYAIVATTVMSVLKSILTDWYEIVWDAVFPLPEAEYEQFAKESFLKPMQVLR